MTRSRVASGSDRRWIASRTAASSWSPLWATPPPMTTSDGLKKLTTLASIRPTRRPASVMSASATGSPNDAAHATSAAVTRPSRSSASRSRALRPSRAAASPSRASAAPPASASRQPTLPQRQTTDGIVGDLDVAHVPGTALGTAVEPPVGDDARPDARADLDHHHVLVAHRDARPPLPHRQHVDVVVHPHRARRSGRRAAPAPGSRPSRA